MTAEAAHNQRPRGALPPANHGSHETPVDSLDPRPVPPRLLKQPRLLFGSDTGSGMVPGMNAWTRASLRRRRVIDQAYIEINTVTVGDRLIRPDAR